MKYLWDTDSCIHFLNGTKEIVQKTQSIGAENICTTMLNIFELKFGAYNSNRPEANLERIEKLRMILTILDDFDLLIAGFASVKKLCLVTNNIKHFQHIPDLNIENWLPG